MKGDVMSKKPHGGPLFLAAFFAAAAAGFGFLTSLPLHLTIAAKVLLLLYAASLLALAFIPVRGEKRATGPAADTSADQPDKALVKG